MSIKSVVRDVLVACGIFSVGMMAIGAWSLLFPGREDGGVLSYPAQHGDLTAGGWATKGTATGGDLYGKPEYLGPAKDVPGTFYPDTTDRIVTVGWFGSPMRVNLTKLVSAFGMLVTGLAIGWWLGRKSAHATFANDRW